MKTQIEKVSAQLSKMLERAEELYDSENQETSARYETVCEHLETAIEELQQAVLEFK
jgi:ElaB/YqjD/DUF883 family membrane-anchored ribosome-binding protein